MDLYLNNPNDPGNSSSAVWLRDNPIQPEDVHSFLIPIGAVGLDSYREADDPVAEWIHGTLAGKLAGPQ